VTDRRLGPIFARGAALRALGKKPRRIARWSLAIGALGCALIATIAAPPRPWLVWNVSASAPLGLYGVGARAGIARGDMVIARVPQRWRTFAARRHYIPANVPLVKRVAAVPGDHICVVGSVILVNGAPVAVGRPVDGRGQPMPGWSGCVTLRNGAHLLLMDSPDSFDGRYFGPTRRGDIVGEAYLLWRR
jgi:conjugative transfer signal peptidase TraF